MPPKSSVKIVARNFTLPLEQAEWLRDMAFNTRSSQAALVREALEDIAEKYKRGAGVYQQSKRD